MASTELLSILGTIVVAAAAFVLATRRVGVPTILACLLAGVAFGPILGVVELASYRHGEPQGPIDVVGELGIILLLFVVGLEMSLDKVRQMGRTAFVTGSLQMTATFLGGLGLGVLWGLPIVAASIVGIAMAFSSTVVAVKMLDQKGDSDTAYGRIALGTLLVQDLAVAVVLTVLAGLADASGAGAHAIVIRVSLAFAGMIGLLGLVLAASRWILPRVVSWAGRSSETLFVWSLAFLFLVVVLAQALHLSKELGAFVAGLAFAQLDAGRDLRRRIRPLMNFFIVVFFVSVGARMEPLVIVDYWGLVLALSLFVVAGKVIFITTSLRSQKTGPRTSILVAMTLSQTSEFSIILTVMAASARMIDHAIVAIVMAVSLVTIAISSYLISWNRDIAAALLSRGMLAREPAGPDEPAPSRRMGHIVVLGMNTLGLRIVERFAEQGAHVVAIDIDIAKLQLADTSDRVHGNVDYASVLEEADVPTARLVVSALRIQETNNLLAWRCHQWDVPLATQQFDAAAGSELEELGVALVLDIKRAGAQRLHDAVQKALKEAP